MSLAGILILLGFFVFAGLMVARWLPAILALPLMAVEVFAVVVEAGAAAELLHLADPGMEVYWYTKFVTPCSDNI